MKKLNPVEKTKYINRRYKEYLKSSFAFGNSNLQDLFVQQLEKEKLLKGPFIDINYPFQRGKNIYSLVDEGVLCKSFKNLSNINFERPLYSHQEEAIRLIGEGRNAVITTGTGSGKTECFLYPILNSILNDIENGNTEPGIRAIFLYPMNALVNDQIERIRKVLSGCSKITFGFFTGDTPEKASESYRQEYAEEIGCEIPKNELISREEIRKEPPHLLFTNYSMLEFLLIRPNDYTLFEERRLQNWKYVVLDEAHTYNGSLGIELSMLLRRLISTTIKKPNFILTSATLGEKGKSEKDILKFAHNLTSAKFEVKDIIFSKREYFGETSKYRIEGKCYSEIKQKLRDIDEIIRISHEYDAKIEGDSKEALYDLLYKDKNVYEISEFLKNKCREFVDLYDKMKAYMNEQELIDLIDIINYAEKNGKGIFDLKYHSFIRPLSGAFVTLGKKAKITLTKTNEIDGMRAFEIGNCKYCNSPYVFGKICAKGNERLTYLFQNNEIDIYENYGNQEYVKVDYFLLENSINEEEIEEDCLEPFELCVKCGEIHAFGNLNAEKCKCGDEYRKRIYRVISSKSKSEETIYNNINQCPCCGHRSVSGIIKAFNVGKDEGTAIISQILYEAIDEEDDKEKKAKKILLGEVQPETEKIEKAKQFLAFSDSRQQASFAALFYDSNHTRMLRKRLIWEVIKQFDYETVTWDKMIARLSELIETKNLFDNKLDPYKNAWAAALVDLLKIDGTYDCESLGIYFFDLDIDPIVNELDDEQIKIPFEKFNVKMTRENLRTLIQIIVGSFKTTPAINYTDASLSPGEIEEILEYRRFTNCVALKLPSKEKNIKSLLPIKTGANAIVRYVSKAFECSVDAAQEMIKIVFDFLVGNEKYLIKDGSKPLYRIKANKFVVKNYKNCQYYRCNKCGRFTPYNINNKCPHDKCVGELLETNPDEALANNYYRQQYLNKKIERVVIKEHTAQLERKTAKEYQKAFKNKEINILSCSTTFEMGVDIGDLETVFMRNVPPTPANYVQRAGRAGRRKDSSAYILTYCSSSSHDFTYFSEPEKMISGIINPPYFNIGNKKIVKRHLMATSLGYYFRAYKEHFQNLDAFIINGGVNTFKNYIYSRPEPLNKLINEKILNEPEYEECKNFKWLDSTDSIDDRLESFIETIQKMYSEFEIAEKEANSIGDYIVANYYKKQKERLKTERVLDNLSRFCVIPKYGFPVDVVNLEIYEDGIRNDKCDINRDLRIAISEYAPDSEVIVDKMKYTSKYITLRKDKEFQKNYYIKCPNCKRINLFLTQSENSSCKYCGQNISTRVAEYYIEPIYGFKTGPTKERTLLKPVKSYLGEVSYVGGGKIDERCLNFNNYMLVETSSDDELLIMNKSDFYMCQICGYAEVVKGFKSPSIQKKHNDYRRCTCNNEHLTSLHLGHKFKTDVAKFIIPSLSSESEASYAYALSFLYAFLEGISIALEIDRKDIDGVLQLDLEYQSYDIVIYDNVPGGAGHTKRLLNSDAVKESLLAALKKVSEKCCDENTSCYNCLRNYYNQSYHSRIQRKYAIDVIKQLLEELENTEGKYQNERVSLNKNISKLAYKMKISLGNGGRNPGNESSKEVWQDLLEDCSYDDEKSIINMLIDSSSSSMEIPYYNKDVLIEETGERIIPNLLWKEKQVMLFLNDMYSDYQIAQKTGWTVFCTKDKFDINELLSKVGE